MNIQISDRTFTSAAEQLSHAAAVRKRLLFGKKKPAFEAAPAVDQQPIMAQQIPMWQRRETSFDAHVQLFNHVRKIQSFSTASTVKFMQGEWGEPPRKTMKEIVEEVLVKFPGVTLSDVRGRRRVRSINVPRQLAIYEVHRQRNDLSTPAIGRWFGGRDHTTILHAIWKMDSILNGKEA
jgi:chromosomal replication initiation ATPase DnaA